MEKRIYYHDTDSGGVVYYSNYLKYLEEARTEFLEQHAMSVELCHQRGLLYAVRECNIIYKSPARYGDTIVCDAKLLKVTAAQLIFEQKIYNKKTNQLLVESTVTLVCLNSNFKPTQIPEDLKEQLIKSASQIRI